VAAFAYWVWPTPWRYESGRFLGGDEDFIVRVHRVSGRPELLLLLHENLRYEWAAFDHGLPDKPGTRHR